MRGVYTPYPISLDSIVSFPLEGRGIHRSIWTFSNSKPLSRNTLLGYVASHFSISSYANDNHYHLRVKGASQPHR